MRNWIWLLCALFCAGVAEAAPSNTIVIPNSFVAGTTANASDVNANENEVQGKYNAHTHIDLTTTSSNTFSVGNGSSTGSKIIYANNGTASLPQIRYNNSTAAWEYANDGSTFSAFGTSSGLSGGTPALTLSTVNSAGVASTGLRTDATVAAFDNSTPTAETSGVSGSTGTSAYVARADHLHALPTLSPGGWTNQQVFTSSATWTKPGGVTSVFVEVWGAGGGAGGSAGTTGGSGAGGGGYASGVTAVTGNVSVTVGTGGTSGANADGTAGGNSSFAGSTTISATGGGAGLKNGGTIGAGGTSSGTMTNTGEDGIIGGSTVYYSGITIGGKGGDSGWNGRGGNVVVATNTGGAGRFPGGGGAGGTGSNTAGGAGGNGLVTVYWNQ